MKYLLASSLHLLLSLSAQAQPAAPAGKTSEVIQQEQNVPGTNVDLEKINTSPNPIEGTGENVEGTIKVPRSKQEQQDLEEIRKDKKRRLKLPQKQEEVEEVNFIEEEQV